MRKFSLTTEHPDTETEVTIHFTFTPGDPGRYYGLPENCYPAEPAEVEFDSAEPPEFADWAREWLQGDGFDAAVEEATERDQQDRADYEYERDKDDKLMGVGRYAPAEGSRDE